MVGEFNNSCGIFLIPTSARSLRVPFLRRNTSTRTTPPPEGPETADGLLSKDLLEFLWPAYSYDDAAGASRMLVGGDGKY